MSKIEKALAGTKKALGAITADAGGHFYFVSDSKGQEVVLLINTIAKDKTGSKTLSQGRGVLQEFKSAHKVKPIFSHGKVSVSGSTLVFEIEKGTAKPGLMKQGMKKSTSLHAGVGPQKSALLSARIRMAGQDAPEALSSSEQEAHAQALESWRNNVKNARMLAEIGGMSEAEIVELFEAETAFKARRDSLPSPKAESAELEAQAAKNDQHLQQLDARSNELLQALSSGNREEATRLQQGLDEARADLAQSNPVGALFSDGKLAPVDQEVFNATLDQSLTVLIKHIKEIQQEGQEARARVESLSEPSARLQAEAALTESSQQRSEALSAIERQFQALRKSF